jgi:hypothetical protein
MFLMLKNLLRKSLLYRFFANAKKNILKFKDIQKIIVFNFKSIKGNVSKHFMFLLSSTDFITYYLRPKKSDNFNFKTSKRINQKDLGLIIQGPTKGYENFIYETIKIYKKNFNGAQIVLSIWDDANKLFLKEVKKLNIKIIISSYKKNMFQGFDHQIQTTTSAISFLKNKTKYILKTRTDCRIYSPNCFEYLLSLIKTFALKNNVKNQKQRIVFSSLITPKFRVYGATDILVFGTSSDINKYFSKEFFYESLKKYKLGKFPKTFKGTLLTGEIMLCAKYLIKKNIKLKWDLDHWCQMLENYFIIADHNEIDLFWKKYSYENEGRFTLNFKNQTRRIITFGDWLNIYNKNYSVILKYNYKEKWKINNGKFEYIGSKFY